MNALAEVVQKPNLSIIAPFYNEEDSVVPLHDALVAALEAFGRPYELIFVNDRSTDRTEELLAGLAQNNQRVRVINFRRNHGQTAAMQAGIDAAQGDIIIPIDGDLQNDPIDIPRLVTKLEEGFDVVSGWRRERQDDTVKRKLPSAIANWVISKISGVHLHDYGCTLKAYRREVLADVRLYGEMHRFVPIYASWHGARVTELVVTHHARRFGRSKYGLERIAKVVLDLAVVKFLSDFDTKPIYVFGFTGLAAIAFSALTLVFTVWLRLFEGIAMIATPLPLLSAMAFLVGILCILLGLLAELMVRVYYETQNKPTYFVKSRLNFPDQP
ncbi:MAG: glycosyltransferase family 2 protein [Alphaproteobacteria bacterium]|nr:glycosyltransferase family 2 protein [Alphaproteobacteria bacterium]